MAKWPRGVGVPEPEVEGVVGGGLALKGPCSRGGDRRSIDGSCGRARGGRGWSFTRAVEGGAAHARRGGAAVEALAGPRGPSCLFLPLLFEAIAEVLPKGLEARAMLPVEGDSIEVGQS